MSLVTASARNRVRRALTAAGLAAALLAVLPAVAPAAVKVDGVTLGASASAVGRAHGAGVLLASTARTQTISYRSGAVVVGFATTRGQQLATSVSSARTSAGALRARVGGREATVRRALRAVRAACDLDRCVVTRGGVVYSFEFAGGKLVRILAADARTRRIPPGRVVADLASGVQLRFARGGGTARISVDPAFDAEVDARSTVFGHVVIGVGAPKGRLEITIPVTAAVSAGTLALHSWDPVVRSWISLPTTVDASGHRLVGTITARRTLLVRVAQPRWWIGRALTGAGGAAPVCAPAPVAGIQRSLPVWLTNGEATIADAAVDATVLGRSCAEAGGVPLHRLLVRVRNHRDAVVRVVFDHPITARTAAVSDAADWLSGPFNDAAAAAGRNREVWLWPGQAATLTFDPLPGGQTLAGIAVRDGPTLVADAVRRALVGLTTGDSLLRAVGRTTLQRRLATSLHACLRARYAPTGGTQALDAAALARCTVAAARSLRTFALDRAVAYYVSVRHRSRADARRLARRLVDGSRWLSAATAVLGRSPVARVGGFAAAAVADAAARPALLRTTTTARRPARQVDVGMNFACAVLASGTVRCWGDGADGRNGGGSTQDQMDTAGDVPSTVPLGGPATAVALGDTFACALLQSGAVRCWGDGTNGQVGAGATADLLDQPGESPSTVPLGAPGIAVTAGSSFACALLAGGTVRCWGFGGNGRLGSGSTATLMDTAGDVPSTVALGGVATSIAAGDTHACAVLADRTVRCWGSGLNGANGSGSTASLMDQPGEPPATVAVGGPVAAMSAGVRISCAVLVSGGVRCWGFGSQGAMGDGMTNDRMDQVGEPPSIVAMAGQVAGVAAGAAAVCSRTAAGALGCWGDGANGQLGAGSATDVLGQPGDVPVAPVLGDAVAQVALGPANTTCAVTRAGAVRCWGSGASGATGSNNIDTLMDGPGEVPSTVPLDG